jgi:MraZ protein
VDDKGRLKIPSGFLQLLETNYGSEVFVTSLTGENARVYPMEIWIEVEHKLAAIPNSHPSKVRFLDRVHFFGQATALDRQGRLLIPATLRESAQMNGNVDVLGKYNFLEIWNHERFLERLRNEPFTEEDGRALAEFDI